MNRSQAEDAAVAIVKAGWRDPRCTAAYCYTRGCYAVIVYANRETLALVDDDAVRLYLANHTGRAKTSADGS